MNKEQIFGKIIHRITHTEGHVEENINRHGLASYLATIEERLERVEGKTPKFIKRTDGLTEIEYYPTPTEVKDWEKELEDNCIQWFDCPRTADAVRYMKSFIRNLLSTKD
jgi:hypothetical protein